MPRKQRYEDDGHCFVCGTRNPDGLHLTFDLGPKEVLTTSFTPTKTYQGFKNVTHGGILGLIFDEMMVNLPLRLGKMAVSAGFKVRLKAPVPVGERVDFACRVREEKARFILLSATAHDRTGKLVAEAEGTCVKV